MVNPENSYADAGGGQMYSSAWKRLDNGRPRLGLNDNAEKGQKRRAPAHNVRAQKYSEHGVPKLARVEGRRQLG
jgi:hypothetical protein